MNPQYIKNLRMRLVSYWRGFAKKFEEVEKLRYFEDTISLGPEEKVSGIEVRTGLTANLVETIKAAQTTNQPQVKITPLRSSQDAKANSDKREAFWELYLKKLNRPIPTLSELVDAQAMGMGVLKAAFKPWPRNQRKRSRQGRDEYLDKQKALKMLWGPPFNVVALHPLTFLPQFGSGNRLQEVIEYGLKSRAVAYKGFGSEGFVTSKENVQAQNLSGSFGFPAQEIQTLPSDVDSSDLVEVTEYWRYSYETGWPDIYQMYVGDELVYEEPNKDISSVCVCYFPLLGRTSSSKDPDKLSLSVAEFLRHNEPILNRAFTRMAEATELLVQKRLGLELPEGSTEEFAGELDESNNPIRTVVKFEPGKAVSLPAGGKVVDAFSGVEHVYSSMPFIELIMRLAGQHGIAPIFKGMGAGSADSGYKDNSLYMMALSQFMYMIYAFEDCLADLIRWLEYELVTHVKQEIWVDDLSLRPKDVEDFPVKVEVKMEAYLPQNIIAEGQFYMSAHKGGYVTKRTVLEEGFHRGQPETEILDRMKEDIQQLMIPALYQDVMEQVLGAPEVTQSQPSGLVGPSGQPISSNGGPGGGGGGIEPFGMGPRGVAEDTGRIEQVMSGYRRAGMPRQPPQQPGATVQGAPVP